MDPTSTKARLRAVLATRDLLPVPLDLSWLLICQLAGRDIDIEDELAALDELAGSIAQPSFEGVVTGLFGGSQPLRGNTDAYYDIANSLLSDVRRSGLGIPISLTVLAMEVGRRRGVAMVGVGMPGHFLLGDGADVNRFADPFSGIGVFGPDGARQLFHQFSGNAVTWNESYLRPATNVEILFRILNNIKVACSKSFAQRHHLPWVLEVLSWFPQGSPFDPAVAQRIVAPFN